MGSGKIKAHQRFVLREFKAPPSGIRRYIEACPELCLARRAWWQRRKLRIEEHSRRIQHVLLQVEATHRRAVRGRGWRRPIWCVELRREFASLCDAARFVRRAPNCIARAIARGGRCAGFQWEEFDPADWPSTARRPVSGKSVIKPSTPNSRNC